MTKEYQVVVYGWITADSLQEAEEIYASGEWDVDYHEMCDYDDNGNEVKYNQWEIEEMNNA